MRLPEVLVSLTDQGVIDEVIRPLKSGKEAQVYLVSSQGERRVAKVYKSMHRSFKHRAQYTEGRKVRNSRDQRAMQRRTRHGKAQEEAAWKSAEVDIIYRLHDGGVRVPTPYNFIDGVLLMELVCGDDGHPAPRLGELALDAETATRYFKQLLTEVVKMLCVGIVHGDLSDYNVLVDAHGPVVIDFPQAVDAASNRNAKKLLIRDVDNLSAFLKRCIPRTRHRPYGQEIWAAYEKNLLSADMELTGSFRGSKKKTNLNAVLSEIDDASMDEARRQGEPATPRRRRQVVLTPTKQRKDRPTLSDESRPKRRRRRKKPGTHHPQGQGPRSRSGTSQAQRSEIEGQATESRPKRRRRRRAAPDNPHHKPHHKEPVSVGSDDPPRRRRRRRKPKPPSDVLPENKEASHPPSKRRRRRRRNPQGE